MKIIDAHIHYHTDPYFQEIAAAAGHENSQSHLETIYAKKGIVHAVVMGNRGLEPEKHNYPDFMSYCVGLDSSCFQADAVHESARLVEEHLKRKSCVGIKLYPGYNPYYVSDPVYTPFYELALRYKKPVAIHTGATSSPRALLRYSHPLTLDEVAVAWPEVQFIMCHFGNPWFVDAAAVLEKNANVAADLSGMLVGLLDMPAFTLEQAGYIEQLKAWLRYPAAFDRLLYATDWPLANIDNYLEFVAGLIPTSCHEQVFFENANRIYQLGL